MENIINNDCEKIRSTRKNNISKFIFNTFVSILLSALILNFIIYFYKYNGARILNEDKTTDYKWSSYQFVTNMEEGFSCSMFDRYGFNNDYTETNENIDILIMGSSHMEAINVNSKENIGYCLKSLLKCKTYNIGISSHNLVVCLRNLLTSYLFYKPKCILIETDSVCPNINELQMYLDGKYKRKRAYREGSKEVLLQKCFPSMKWIINQLSAWIKQSRNTINTTKRNENSDNKSEYKNLLNLVLKKAISGIPNNIPFIIFYHPSYILQPDGSIKNNTDKWYLDTFAKTCKNNNIFFIDMSEDFEKYYKTKHILPYGFINTKIGAGHLNKYGHEVIAKRLAKEITNVFK